MQIFISSVISGFEEHRAAAVEAIRSLGHDVIQAENFSAATTSAQIACLNGVRQADLVIVLLGDRYGAVQSSGQSATQEEFEEATSSSKPVLVFVRTNVSQEPKQQAFIDMVQGWTSGSFTGSFDASDSLRSAIIKAIHDWEMAGARGSVDEAELAHRAVDAIGSRNRYNLNASRLLVFSLAGSPHQQIVRPSAIEDVDFQRELKQSALFGACSIFDDRNGTSTKIHDGALMLEQRDHELRVSEDGALLLKVPLPSSGHGMTAIIEEDVRDTIARGIGFLEEILKRIDSTERQSHVALAVAILDVGVTTWRTRREHDANPNTMTISTFDCEDAGPVLLNPAQRSRSSFRSKINEMTEDFIVLLRRQF